MAAVTQGAQEFDGQESAGLDIHESLAKGLFLGKILDRNLFPYPQYHEDEKDTLGMIVDSLDRFLASHSEQFADWDVASSQPAEYIQSLRDMGLFGLIIPEEHGGLGLSNAAYARVLQQSSRYDSSTSLTIGAHSSIGMKGLLLFGSDEQKKRYLPRLASGEMISAFCLTEPGSGSDAGSIRTRAVKNEDGSWILDGEKIWITNGGIADFYTVFARTEGKAGRISAFLVERSWPGVETGAKEDKFGIRASSTTSVHFSGVRVPAENLLGKEGKGFKVAMSILNNGRTGLGGGAVGGMKTCIALAAQQAMDRKQFGRPIASFGLIQEKIARMAVDCFAAESVVRMVAHYIDSDCTDYSVEAAISKVFASEAMWRTANEAMQIAAGSGYMKELPYDRIVRDSRILTIFEGTSEILRLFIALTGIKDAGDSLKELKGAVDSIFNHPIKGFGLLSDYAGRRITQATALGRDRLGDVPDALAADAQVYEKYTVALGRATDSLLRRHGRGIIDRQQDLARAADVVVDLFVGLCVVSRVSAMDAGDDGYEQAITMSHLFAQSAKRRMNQSLRRLSNNEDEAVGALAGFVFERGGYAWDDL